MRGKGYKITLWVIVILVCLSFAGGGTIDRLLRMRTQKRGVNTPLVQVADMPITNLVVRSQIGAELERRAKYDPDVDPGVLTYEVIDQIIDNALLTWRADQQNMPLSDAFIDERLKEEPQFRNEKGELDEARWNLFVGKGLDWKLFRNEKAESIKRRILGEVVTASARVLDSEVRKTFEKNHTQLKVRYALIALPVQPAEEDIQKQYEGNKERYQHPEKRVAEFLSISLRGERPPLADELVTRARAGEDFLELIKTYSAAPGAKEKTDLLWISPSPTLRPHEKAALSLGVGEVSDPVEGPAGYYLFKAEDEKIDEVTAERSVGVRQILLSTRLGNEERQVRTERAEALAQKAKETGDLRAVAETEGLEVKVSSPFSVESTEIENVPFEDCYHFRAILSKAPQDAIAEVVVAAGNAYVAKIAQVIPAVDRPFEEVRDQVVEDTIEALREAKEYRAEVERMSKEIAKNAHSIADIKTLFPDLDVKVEDSNEFSVGAPNFTPGIYVQPQDVYDLVGWGEPGLFNGPVTDFTGNTYFVELVEKKPPDETTWQETFPAEEDQLRQSLKMTHVSERFGDYIKDLRERAENTGLVNLDTAGIQNLAVEIRSAKEKKSGQETEAQEPSELEGVPFSPVDFSDEE